MRMQGGERGGRARGGAEMEMGTETSGNKRRGRAEAVRIVAGVGGAAAVWISGWAWVAAEVSRSAADEPPHPALTRDADREPYEPEILTAGPEAERAAAALRPAPGLRAELYAAEPLTAHPVAFAFDERGRVFVCETFRHSDGVTDNRSHMYWLDDDMAARTVADRLAMYRRRLSPEAFAAFSRQHDRIRLLEDTNGDGRADRATVFADGFRAAEDGIGAGVLARRGDVFYTCVPKLWRLRDENGDGRADRREILHDGYGVRVAFLGHDLHGLRIGPDGRLYFTVGDRGMNVTTFDGRAVRNLDSGAVLRCELDGSNLELFATGMRNPQELAFDEFGNLFTGENNSDSGDEARIAHVVPGMDAGWRMGFQYLEFPTSRGPWNEEALWKPHFPGQPAHIVPPVANFANGPSGFAYHPGVARLPRELDRHFLLCDFKGAPGISGVWAFKLEPEGASFRLEPPRRFVWNVEATDVDFSPDGDVYVSDWVEGWNKTGRGRIFKLFADDLPPEREALIEETRRLIAGDWGALATDRLAELLGHPDERVRREAQFAMAERGREGLDRFAAIAAAAGGETLPRLHAAWGLGMIGRLKPEFRDGAATALAGLTDDADPEIRAWSIRMLGELGRKASAAAIAEALRDASARVRMFAALALGDLGEPSTVPALVAFLRENDDRDPYLRHAGVMGLLGTADAAALEAIARDESSAARLAAAVAYRRREAPEIAALLSDPDPRVATEAALAIHDVPIAGAMPALAAIALKPGAPNPLARRVLRANARLGGRENAKALAGIAAERAWPELLRLEAIRALREWPKPIGRDPVTGLWNPGEARPAAFAAEALAGALDELLGAGGGEAPRRDSDRLKREALQAVAALGIAGASKRVEAIAVDAGASTPLRIEALRTLEALGTPELERTLEGALTAADGRLRGVALEILARLDPEKALPPLAAALETGSVAARQAALGALERLPGGGADRLVAEWLEKLARGDAAVAPEIELDLLGAGEARKGNSEAIATRLAAIEAARPDAATDPLARHRPALRGGDAERGRDLALNRAELACVRCHVIEGRGGEVGPGLDGIAAKRDREYLLESIVRPDARIAEGFETIVVLKRDGSVVNGVLKGDDGKTLRLALADGEGEVATIEIPADEIEERGRGPSAMPADILKSLSMKDIRDLVEYLASLERPGAAGPAPAPGTRPRRDRERGGPR